MIVLTGKNLGERHRELNTKVAEVVTAKKNFNDIKIEEEGSDVDKLYKIDVASHYKDIDYIIEILKSGDSLYVTRALKCQWLYHDDNSHIINEIYLHENIFPFMSIKMKKKMLTTISMHIQNYKRAANFYLYCEKHHITNIAFKFLIFSSDELKLNVLKNMDFVKLYPFIETKKNLLSFVGNSLILATACIETCKNDRFDIIYNLSYLYTTDNDKYLEFLEKYEIVDGHSNLKRLGIRISKDIMLKYKNRVVENNILYVNILNKTMLAKYTSKSEAKQYLSSLLPQTVENFWSMDFCKKYDYILNVIPINEQFEFIKQLFTKSYPGKPFETDPSFYWLKYYNMMTIDQRELWALHQYTHEDAKEMLGLGNDYIWCKFVNIDKALIELKKLILVAPDCSKRACYLETLVEATRDHNDLKKVLDYYYERHINESVDNKRNFVDKIVSIYNVWELNIECWEALNKLFYSMDIYSARGRDNAFYKTLSVFYHILHNIDMPEALLQFINIDVNYSYFTLFVNKLSKDKSDIILQHLIKLFVDKLEPFEQNPENKKVGKDLLKYVNNILTLLRCFDKKDEECPEIVKRFMDIHVPKSEKSKTVTAKDLFRYLKTDAALVVDELRHSDSISETHKTPLNKLKVYYHNDVAQEYINLCDRIIPKPSDGYRERSLIEAAVFSLFQLGDESYKLSMMEKYCPSESKINHSLIDRNLLNIQQAICKYMWYSRPPVPFKYVFQYIKGDYVHYCKDMFNMYMANLPLPLLMQFTENLLNKNLSIQKHGLRLAFQSYDSENLKTLVLCTWKKTKNVSLRMLLYKSLYNRLTQLTSSEGDEEQAKILYEALKVFTSDLHEDDHDDLFELISSYCQRHHHVCSVFIDDYLQTAWLMALKLPKKKVNIHRQIQMISSIDDNITLVQRDFVRQNIIDDYVNEILEQIQLQPIKSKDVQDLQNAKLRLLANYILQYRNDEELEECLALISYIFKKCKEMWHDKYEGVLVFQKLYFDFIRSIENKIHDIWCNDPKDTRNVPILKQVLNMLLEALPLKQIYMTVWTLKLTIFIGISLNERNAASHEEDGSQVLSHEEIICDKIANHIEGFIRELLAKQQLYPVLLLEVSTLIKHKLSCLLTRKNWDTLCSQSLTNIGLKETHLLALMILPTDVPKDAKEIHTKILTNIQAFENDEIQSYLYFKFFH